ncbi:hypothetical protein JCM8547_005414 [Rhodosporidiobolus lusitaniae]
MPSSSSSNTLASRPTRRHATLAQVRLKNPMPLPVELVHETIRLSLLPSSSPSLSHSDSPCPSGASTPLLSYSSSSTSSSPSSSSSQASERSNPFDDVLLSAGVKPPTRQQLLLTFSLTSHLFRSVSQPLLFQHARLPTLPIALSFLRAVEGDEDLAASVRTIELGGEPGGGGGGGGRLDARMVLGRLGRACGKVKEVGVRGCGRVRVEELGGMKDLRTLTLSSSLLSPSLSSSSSLSFPNLTHLTLHSLHLTLHSLPPSFFPSLTYLSLTTPRDSVASSPGVLASFLEGVAPELKSFQLFDQSSGGEGGLDFNPLLDAFSAFSSQLTHLSTVNAHPFVFLPSLSSSSRHSLTTLSMHLSGPLASPRLRWAPLRESLLRETLDVVEAVLTGREGLPGWVKEVEGVRRVRLPRECFEGSLERKVEEVREAVIKTGKGVELLPILSGDEEDEKGWGWGKEREEGTGKAFWREVDEREREERMEEKRKRDGE